MDSARWDLPRFLSACAGLGPAERAKAADFALARASLGPVAVAAQAVQEGVLGFQDAAAFLDAARTSLSPEAPDLSGRRVGGRRLARRILQAAGAGLYEAAESRDLVAVYDETPDPSALVARLRALSDGPGAELLRPQDSGAEGKRAWARFGPLDGPFLGDAPLRGREPLLSALLSASRAVETLHRAGERGVRLRPDVFVRGADGGLRLIPLLRTPASDDPAARLAFPEGLAPELLLGESGDAVSDLHALGTLMLDAVAGLDPDWPVLLRRVIEAPGVEPFRREDLPDEAVKLIRRLLDPDPLGRPPEAAAVVAPLARLAGASRPAAAPTTPAPEPAAPLPAPSRLRLPVLPLAIASLVLTLATAGLLVQRFRERPPIPPPPGAAVPPAAAPDAAPTAPAPLPPTDDPEEDARRALVRDDLPTALSLYRRAQREKPRPSLASAIEELEARLRSAARERADAERLERALAALPPEAALRACDDFLDRYPASPGVDRIVALKAELRTRAPGPAEPARPPPDATKRPGLRGAGISPRALPPGLPEALGWLARHQGSDGLWSVRGFARECEGPDCAAGPGSSQYDLGVSALAALAILASGIGWADRDEIDGHSLGETLRQAILRILRAQGPDGALGDFRPGKPMYNHALATYALAEAFRTAPAAPGRPAEIEELKAGVLRAVRFLADAQQPGRGWRYAAKNVDSDLSVTALSLLALGAARHAGVPVPPAALEGGFAFMEAVTEPATSRSGYTHRGSGKVFIPDANETFEHHETMSAAALLCRVAVRKEKGPTLWTSRARLFRGDPPREDPPLVDAVYWYYGTRAHREAADPEAWSAWKSAVVRVLLKQQNRPAAGCRRGSWNTVDRWSSEGGRVYVTALNALTLAHATMPAPFGSAGQENR